MTLPFLMLVTLGPSAMISDLNHLCYHHYSHVLDPILQVIVTYTTKKIHFRDDNFGNVMEHFYDSTGMTILILS